MISKSLSTSEKFAALHDTAGLLAEFCQTLYMLLITHSDDYGRLQGDTFTVKHLVLPSSPRSVDEFDRGLAHLHDVGLITWYRVHGRRYVQIWKFDPHQFGLKRRAASMFPAPVADETRQPVRPYAEVDIEEYLAGELKAGRLVIGGLTVDGVDRQVRRHSSYLDLVAHTTEGVTLVFEVRRRQITNNAIEQVLRYRSLLPQADVIPIVVGSGVASDVQPASSQALLVTYDETLFFRALTLFHVKSRQITVTHVTAELNLRELNRSTSSGAVAPPLPSSLLDVPEDNIGVITKIAHEALDQLGPGHADLPETVKSLCASRRIVYDSGVVRKAIESATVQRSRH